MKNHTRAVHVSVGGRDVGVGCRLSAGTGAGVAIE